MTEMIYCSICREFFECHGNDSCVCPHNKKKELKKLDFAIGELMIKGVLNESCPEND